MVKQSPGDGTHPTVEQIKNRLKNDEYDSSVKSTIKHLLNLIKSQEKLIKGFEHDVCKLERDIHLIVHKRVDDN